MSTFYKFVRQPVNVNAARFLNCVWPFSDVKH